jgi:2,3-bisphosphoglycerate-dependent phosphoglycerate mutase
MQLYLIRHGQSENNALWERTGSSDGRSSDPVLTELGHRQARRLAEFLAEQRANPADEVNGGRPDHNDFGLTHLYTSLMRRAIETAEYIAQALELPLLGHPDAHEWGGIFQGGDVVEERVGLPGPGRAELAREFPDLRLPAGVGDEGWWNRPYEQRQQVPERAQRFIDDLLAGHGGTEDRVAVVGHGGFLQNVLQYVLEMPVQEGEPGRRLPRWFRTYNASISRLDFNEDQIVMAYLNRVDHLPEAWIS